MKIKMLFLKESLINYLNKNEDYMNFHELFLNLTFLRILPYAKKDEKEKILKILKI